MRCLSAGGLGGRPAPGDRGRCSAQRHEARQGGRAGRDGRTGERQSRHGSVWAPDRRFLFFSFLFTPIKMLVSAVPVATRTAVVVFMEEN